MPDIKWSNGDHYVILSGPAAEKSKILAETFAFMQLFQYNSIVTSDTTVAYHFLFRIDWHYTHSHYPTVSVTTPVWWRTSGRMGI